jgi:hypothetical protein
MPRAAQRREHVELAGREAVLTEDAVELLLDNRRQTGETAEDTLGRDVELGPLSPPFGLDARHSVG